MSFTIEFPAESGMPKGRITIEMPPDQAPSAAERVLASPAGRFLKGASAIIDGPAEMLPYTLGLGASLGGAAPNRLADWLFEESRRVRQMNAEGQQIMQQARERTGNTGTDVAGTLGNVAGGVVLGMAVPGAVPATAMGRAIYGAGVGGVGGAMAPTGEVDDRRFAEEKAAQTAFGAVTGALATPVLGAVIDRVGPIMDKWLSAGKKQTMSPQLVIDRLRFELAREGVNLSDLDRGMRDRIGREVAAALREGKTLDAAALARKLDFEALGVQGTRGQITRDPAQWNREFNLRQVEGAGEPLVAQVRAVREATGRRLAELGGDAAGDAGDRGAAAIASLQRADEPVRGMVDDAYNAARNAAGRQSRLQPWQFAQMANDALDSGNLGAVLPGEVRTIMNRVATGEIPLTVDAASQMQSLFAAQARMLRQAGNREGALAVDKVAEALRATDLEKGATGAAREAFNAAKKLANARFQTMKAAPAYKAALDAAADPQKFPPEKFLDQFVIRANREAVRNLSEILPEDGANAVRQHLVKHLQDAAFGANRTGDGPMAVERYLKALDAVGKPKLRAFFPADVVADLYRIGRVNAYVTQQPAGIVPNRSGTAAALVNVLQRIPGANLVIGAGRGLANERAVIDALTPEVTPQSLPVLTPALRDLLPLVPAAGGVVAAQ